MDDKGLELSLGLPCGSSSNVKHESDNSISADPKTNTDERTSKIVNDFKNFLGAGIPPSLQRIEPVKPQRNFLNTFSKIAASGSASGDGKIVVGDKRKNMFGELNRLKRQDIETHSSDLQDNKGKASHVSIATDEASTADNEDVAESEPEGSTSRVASHCEEGSKTPGGSHSSSQTTNEVHGNANFFRVQSLKKLNIPYSIGMKESPSVSTPSSSSFRQAGVMLGMTSPMHSTSPASGSMTFGYSPEQIPVLDGDRTWGMVAPPQPLPSPYAGREASISVPIQAATPNSSEAIRSDIHLSATSRGLTKQPATKEGSSFLLEEEEANIFALDYPAIKPGMAADLKFGGSGSFPNLPWVSTTGPGPNGKTISGVTYKFNASQVKIVCACHGNHMTPDEFIRHASEVPPPNSPSTPQLAPLRGSSPAAFAKS